MTERSKADWVSRAILLGWATIAYNLLEGVVAVFFGAEENSIALFGFGVDSFVEVLSAFVVLWRFRKEAAEAAVELRQERTATIVIGVLFLLLAAVVASVSVYQIASHRHPETTVPGLVVSLLSLSFMFFLWGAKLKVARALDSRTVFQDAACSLACIQLSGVLLVGSVIYFFFPVLYWIDSAAALTLSFLIFREGWGAIRAASRNDFSGGCCGCGPNAECG